MAGWQSSGLDSEALGRLFGHLFLSMTSVCTESLPHNQPWVQSQSLGRLWIRIEKPLQAEASPIHEDSCHQLWRTPSLSNDKHSSSEKISVSSCLKNNLSLSFLNPNVEEGSEGTTNTALNKKRCHCRKDSSHLNIVHWSHHTHSERMFWLKWEPSVKEGLGCLGALMWKLCQHFDRCKGASTVTQVPWTTDTPQNGDVKRWKW